MFKKRNTQQFGKETVKPKLDEYCREKGGSSVSESTVGRIIKDLKLKGLILDAPKSYLSFYARTGRFIERKPKPKQKKLKRKGYKPEGAGDLLQTDSITINIPKAMLTLKDSEEQLKKNKQVALG